MNPLLEGPLRTLCADGIVKHPQRAELAIVIADDRFASLESVVLAAFYGPHPANDGPRGKLTAKATLVKADGTRQVLGSLKGRQEAANLPILSSKTVDVTLEQGDVILWDFKLRRFGRLDFNCFEIAALVGTEELPDG